MAVSSGCNRNTKNVAIATRLCKVVMRVLADAPPSVPSRGAPLVSILTFRKFKPKWEARRLERLRVRRARRVSSGGSSEGYNWDSSEEGSVA